MYKNFCTYEQSVLLKELGFETFYLRQGNPNGHIIWRFIDVDDAVDVQDIMNKPMSENWIGIPLKCDVFRWFREVHNQFSQIGRKPDDGKYFYTINGNLGKIDPYIFESDSYEFTEEMCISEHINILKNKIK
jgi:hypothetical protein